MNAPILKWYGSPKTVENKCAVVKPLGVLVEVTAASVNIADLVSIKGLSIFFLVLYAIAFQKKTVGPDIAEETVAKRLAIQNFKVEGTQLIHVSKGDHRSFGQNVDATSKYLSCKPTPIGVKESPTSE